MGPNNGGKMGVSSAVGQGSVSGLRDGDNSPHYHQQNGQMQQGQVQGPEKNIIYETGMIVPNHQEMSHQNPNQEYYVHQG